jgi:phosphomannomutase
MSITFGTDGWRAVISDEFTFANVRHVAQAIAEILLENATTSNSQSADAPLAVVGFDTRFLSDRYAWAVSEVFAGNGLRVALTKADAPTPVVSYAIPHMNAAGGVMITASHNPPRYNGIKLKSAHGGSASVVDTRRVEVRLVANLAEHRDPRRMEMDEATTRGLVLKFDPFPAYR